MKMSESQCKCPERLKGDPKDCTPEQIQECHGEEDKHSCVEKEEN